MTKASSDLSTGLATLGLSVENMAGGGRICPQQKQKTD